MNFRNNAGSTTTVSMEDISTIYRAHNLTVGEVKRVTFVCLRCQSIGVSPDALTKAIVQENYDTTCCGDPETTILPS